MRSMHLMESNYRYMLALEVYKKGFPASPCGQLQQKYFAFFHFLQLRQVMAEMIANTTASALKFVSHISKSGSTSDAAPVEVGVFDIRNALLSRLHLWVLIGTITYIIYTRYFTGLSHIPGPFLASVSNFWKIRAAWQEAMPQQNILLHKKHGPLVRIGPNMISVDDPAALPVIYGFKPIYLKVCPSDFVRRSIRKSLPFL